MLLLVTEVEDLQANPDRLARGTVIEAHLDKAKGLSPLCWSKTEH